MYFHLKDALSQFPSPTISSNQPNQILNYTYLMETE
jgi:hypothetical protein